MARQGGTSIWFNARTSAVPFYETLGFETEGEEYDMGSLGPHYFMRQTIEPESE